MTKIKRELNDKDRAFLDEQTQLVEQHDFGILDSALMVLFGTMYLGTILAFICGTLVGVMRLTNLFPNWLRGVSFEDYAWPIYCLVAVGSLIFVIRLAIKQRSQRRDTLTRIKRELAENEVDEECLTVEAVKCFQEQEHLLKMYLLKMTDGRIRVRYDYESVDTEGRGKSPRTNFPISREVVMLYFKHLKEYRYDFGPTKIRKPRAKPINLHPDLWPEDETWLELPWDELDERYSKYRLGKFEK